MGEVGPLQEVRGIQAGHLALGHRPERVPEGDQRLMDLDTLGFLLALYVFGPTLVVVVASIVLSVFHVKPPRPNGASWFKHRDW